MSSRGQTGASARKRGSQIQDRDVEILRLLDRWGGATAEHVTITFGIEARVAHRRLAALRQWRYATSFRPSNGLPAIWTPTAHGLRECLGDDVTEPPSVSWGSYPHQLALGQVLGVLHRCHVPYLSEREIRRAHAKLGTQPLSLRLGTGTATHQPDAAWFRNDADRQALQNAIAIEIERSRKGGTRLRRILESYDRASSIHHAVYLCNHATHVSTTNVVAGKPWRRGEAPRSSLSHSITVLQLDDCAEAIPLQIERFAAPQTLL